MIRNYGMFWFHFFFFFIFILHFGTEVELVEMPNWMLINKYCWFEVCEMRGERWKAKHESILSEHLSCLIWNMNHIRAHFMIDAKDFETRFCTRKVSVAVVATNLCLGKILWTTIWWVLIYSEGNNALKNDLNNVLLLIIGIIGMNFSIRQTWN